jgi:L-lysine 6-transaminase
MHFNEAFHGRSGYTLSVTNTNDPNKHQRFAKFTDWPRIINPKITFPLEDHIGEVEWLEAQSLKQIKHAIANDPNGIAAVIIETIQAKAATTTSVQNSSNSSVRSATSQT